MVPSAAMDRAFLRSLDPELRRLYAVLRRHPAGLREYELLERLRGDGPLRGLGELELFRVHFLLFHHLYRLRQALERNGRGSLEIHVLRIRLLPLQGPAPNPRRLPAAPDPLAAYYLDLGHLVRTRADDVREMLRWFWRRFRIHMRREDALRVLGLGPGASGGEIRRRFRLLARQHHPDLGGDPERFREVVAAMEVLRAWEEPTPASREDRR
ncbi:DNA-J related domain-containing protein [Deferrisoma camini]|uniref:DNA-J related domain-containing protein n=1 Tax=Deferrisoma camini TaxID=1035120 RepID=UPI00046D936E|nr:DNA-J related domain-containing protein [Deferrisoma camini]